jgi:hypothetical protein
MHIPLQSCILPGAGGVLQGFDQDNAIVSTRTRCYAQPVRVGSDHRTIIKCSSKIDRHQPGT